MWCVTIIINSLIVFLFWAVGFLAISPAYNHFVGYANLPGEFPLPIWTDLVFSVRLTSLVVPAVWLFISLIYLFWLKNKDVPRRTELVQLHTSVSILLGLLFFAIFLTAGILPYLKIGAFID